ncbi:hypothetical protein [Chitinophaga alhagiae]|uniref:hypothetical protein n=1 Tax=Chitinophaga alhagiae TaxID=2203219 RepID=UPI000E5A8C53|nr:hypothetical protein [Chitinophaga alhagiae]
MIIYHKQDLDHALLQEEVRTAFKKECITKEEYQHMMQQYPSRLYTPNPFIRIGLFLLTVLVVLFSFGLFALLFAAGLKSEEALGGYCIFFCLVTYAALEIFIREKQHYRSGVDDGLAWSAAGLALAGCMLTSGLAVGAAPFYGLVFLLGTFFALRFLNMLMGLAAFAGLTGVVYYTLVYAAPDVLPFAVMLLSLGVYLGARRYTASRYYAPTLQLLQVAALAMLYAAGNYYVVRETRGALFGEAAGQMPAGWLFWALTILIPLAYLYAGIRKKDKILLRTGLVLVAAVVFTVRYYHTVLPLETAMVLGGVVMMLLAYGLLRYLAVPKHGFSSEATDEAETLKGLQIAESLVIAQTFKEAPRPDNRFEFGGGTSSGGGAGSEY